MTQRGFTFVEIVVVLALVAIVASITVAGFSLFRRSVALDRDVETVVEMLRQARAETLASKNASSYGVHFEAASATSFSGQTYSPLASDNEAYSLTSDAILVSSLAGGATDVVFKRLTGDTGQGGTITVSSPSANRTRTITVHPTGLIELN